jgi:bifunctional DNase/RNase
MSASSPPGPILSSESPFGGKPIEITPFHAYLEEKGGSMGNLHEMRISGLLLDPVSNMPIVLLREGHGTRSLPIWIGAFEANAIALEMEKVETPRPMTHDLMVSLLGSLGARVARVVVSGLRENTFLAEIVIEAAGRETSVDARPSDALALAIRTGAPIFVTEEVLASSSVLDSGGFADDDEQVKQWLENLKPGDFGTARPEGERDS